MKRARLLILLFAIALSQANFGQRVIIGNITDENNTPLIGVTVVVPGTNIGTITNIEGNYSIELSATDSVLQISFIGYNTEKININNRVKIDIQLLPDLHTIGEVVIIGYGTTKKKDLTSAITVVDNEEIAKVPVNTFEQALQGKAAGVTVVQSAAPGAAATVRIRGTGSINGCEPLYVVDGVIDAESPTPDNIETIQILKDAASCAIYGARGANGVIIVTTKRGKEGKFKINLKSYYGWQKITNTMDLLSADQYLKYWQQNTNIDQMVDQDGERKYPNDADIYRPGRVDSALVFPDQYYYSTDWQDEIYKTGNISAINANVSNGNSAGNYFLGVDHRNNTGTQINGGFKQTSLQLNSDYKKGKFTVGENLNVRFNESGDNDSRLKAAMRQSPLLPVYNSNPLSRAHRYAGNTNLDNSNNENPVGSIYGSNNIASSDKITGRLYAEYKIFESLVLRGNYNLILDDWNGFYKTFKRFEGTTGPQIPEVSISNSSSRSVRQQYESTLTFNKSIKNHNLVALVGYTQEEDIYRSLSTDATGFNVDDPVSMGSRANNASVNIGGNYNEFAMQSVLGRAMYDYLGRYLLTVNLRSDGTSAFQEGKRWKTFPSFSAGWRISDEGFMSDIEWINSLKARAGWGKIGSQNTGGGANVLSLLPTATYVFNNEVANGITIASIIDEDLTWETTATTSIGMDFEAFDNSLKLTVDYYKNINDNMIIPIPIPYSTGMGFARSTITTNAGSLKNMGWEFSVSGHKYKGDFVMDIMAALTFEKTIVTSLGNTEFITGGSTQYYESLTRTEEGKGLGDFYGFVFNGIYQIGDTDIPNGKQPGDIRYSDLDGDGKITAEDRTYLGKPVPDVMYSLTSNFSYKAIDFSLFFNGVYGNEIFNHNRFHTETLAKSFNQGTAVLDAWTPTNPSNTMPRFTEQHEDNNKLGSSRFIEDGSYLRLQNLMLGYTLSSKITSKLHIDNLRIYGTIQNVFTLTKYSGMDPEVYTGGSILGRGIDDSKYPMSRTYALGIELSF